MTSRIANTAILALLLSGSATSAYAQEPAPTAPKVDSAATTPSPEETPEPSSEDGGTKKSESPPDEPEAKVDENDGAKENNTEKEDPKDTQSDKAPVDEAEVVEILEDPPLEKEKRPDPLKGKSKEEKKSIAAESDKNADPTKSVKAAKTMKAVEAAIEERSYKPWDEVGDTKYDWLRTTSGEWLKGEIKELRDDDLVIDSDEFDLQTLSWSDISDIHSPNRFTYVLDDQAVHSGTAEMTKGKLIVHTKDGPRVFDKKLVMTIIPESVSEISKWSFKLSFGASGSYGNSRLIDYSAFTRLRREDAFNRATGEYHGAYGSASDEENTNRHQGDLTWNIYVSTLFYVTPFSGELLYDKFQNIALRALASTGVGMHLIDTKDITFDIDASAAYVGTNFISVEDIDDKTNKDAAAVPHLNLEWDITSDIEFEFDWMSALVVTNIANTFHRGTTMLSIEITDIFDFDLSARYSRQESPVRDEDGVTPKKDDLSVTLGIGLDID